MERDGECLLDQGDRVLVDSAGGDLGKESTGYVNKRRTVKNHQTRGTSSAAKASLTSSSEKSLIQVRSSREGGIPSSIARPLRSGRTYSMASCGETLSRKEGKAWAMKIL
jgi:hypothetical protein